MALPPHWLDDVFQHDFGGVKSRNLRIATHKRFLEAVEAAFKAKEEALEEAKRQEALPPEQRTIGAGPAQKARLAFLEVVNRR